MPAGNRTHTPEDRPVEEWVMFRHVYGGYIIYANPTGLFRCFRYRHTWMCVNAGLIYAS